MTREQSRETTAQEDGITYCGDPDCRAWAQEVVTGIEYPVCDAHAEAFGWDEKVSLNEWEARKGVIRDE